MDDPDRRSDFEALFAAHHAPVRAYVRRRTPPELIDDVVADTFLVAWRRLDQAPRPDPLPWLLAVARRQLANQLRAQRRRGALGDRLRGLLPTQSPGWEPPGGLDPELVAALGALSDAEREALLLVAWEGLDGARAARAADCSPAAFRVRLHRARRRVAAALGEPAGHPTTLSGEIS